MLRRVRGYLFPRNEPAPAASRELEALGFTRLEGVFSDAELTALRSELDDVYRQYPADGRAAAVRDPAEDEDFRYQMFNRSALAQQAIAHRGILDVIEPLLGEDCHVIANTCWRNPPRVHSGHGGGFWHIDAGPHIPRDPAIPWDERIPYPIFAIGAHIYLMDCDLSSGPTGVIPGSHKSGSPPPKEKFDDVNLTYQGRKVVPLTAHAGDVCLFVSDAWHRRLPTSEGDQGRYFLQVHYGRRDIAQRVLPTAQVNHISAQALARTRSDRERQLLGLHQNFFYDG
jgi:ectoine hydroxylase-related dioxygenase (phytanoyl-CoA dioxygenase family)